MKTELVLKNVFQKGFLCFELPQDEGYREALKNILLTCKKKSNGYVFLTLQSPHKPRTTGKDSQNHHLNGHILQICNATGSNYDSVKNAVKMIAVEKFGYPYTIFHGVITPKNERDCSTEECAMLIEAVHILAADLGIILRETND